MLNRVILVLFGFITGFVGTSLMYNAKLISDNKNITNQIGISLYSMMPFHSLLFAVCIVLCVVLIAKGIRGE